LTWWLFICWLFGDCSFVAFVDFILDFGGFTIVGFGCFSGRLYRCSFVDLVVSWVGFTDSRFCL